MSQKQSKNVQGKQTGNNYQAIFQRLHRKYPDFSDIGIKKVYNPEDIDQLEEGLPTLFVVTHTTRLQSTDVDWDMFAQTLKRVKDAKNLLIVAMTPNETKKIEKLVFNGITISAVALAFNPEISKFIETEDKKNAVVKINQFINNK